MTTAVATVLVGVATAVVGLATAGVSYVNARNARRAARDEGLARRVRQLEDDRDRDRDRFALLVLWNQELSAHIWSELPPPPPPPPPGLFN